MKTNIEIRETSLPREGDVLAWDAKAKEWKSTTETIHHREVWARTEALQLEINALKAENAHLKKQINTLAKAFGGIEL